MCVSSELIINSQLPLAGLLMAQSTEFMIALSNYFENKTPENYKIAFDILTQLRNDFYARLKLIDPNVNPLFHMYVLDSDFNNILSTNTNPTIENAISATYQAANLDANYKNGGTLNSYKKKFTPAVPVYKDGYLLTIIDSFIIANYSVNATYEGSYKALYFGCGWVTLIGALGAAVNS
jgi:hypothetical protein